MNYLSDISGFTAHVRTSNDTEGLLASNEFSIVRNEANSLL